MNEESEEIVLSESGPDKKILRLSLSQYKSIPLLNLRYCYKDLKSGEIKPTRKGVALGRNRFVDVYELFEKHHDEILDYFDSPHGANIDPASWKSTLRDAVRSQSRNVVAETTVTSIGGRDLYDVSFEGGVAKVVLNNKNQFVADHADNPSAVDLLGSVAAAFESSVCLVSDEQSSAVAEALDHLRFEFARQLDAVAKLKES